MPIVQRPSRVMIGDGTAIPATFAAIATGDLAVVKRDMTLLAAGQTIADSDEIFIAHGTATGPVLSAPIKGNSVITWSGASFAPDNKQVTHVGYDRITAQTINVLNDTEYSLNIVLKDDKELFSHRQLRKVYFYTSSVAATASEIVQGLVAEIQKDINQSGQLLPLKVIAIGDGTGNSTTAVVNGVTINLHDMTAPTNVGIEITGTEYLFSLLNGFNKVFFEVGLSTGFDSSVVVNTTQVMTLGNGGYEQAAVDEDFGLFYFGFTNRRLHPVSIPTRYVNATPVAVAIAQTVSTTTGDDQITFSAAPAIGVGSRINVVGVAEVLEIKFFISATVAVVTAPVSATVAGAAVTRNEFYSVFTIEHNDDSASGRINGQTVAAPMKTIIYVPSNQTQESDLEALLNPWMASTPEAFPAVNL